MTKDEATAVLAEMIKDFDLPKAAVTQRNQNEALRMAIDAINSQKTGKWIKVYSGSCDFRCPVCKKGAAYATPHCENCGAKLEYK